VPASARSYELVSLTSKESAGVFEFLMAHVSLDARITPALAGAAEWLQQHAIHGMRNGGKNGLIPDSTGGPLWARMYEIGSNRPIFSNRDGVKQYDFNALTDRREGYGWYSDLPAATLTHYRQWLAARGATRVTPEHR
jgi:PelA/Pel-15E family pectate lyase